MNLATFPKYVESRQRDSPSIMLSFRHQNASNSTGWFGSPERVLPFSCAALSYHSLHVNISPAYSHTKAPFGSFCRVLRPHLFPSTVKNNYAQSKLVREYVGKVKLLHIDRTQTRNSKQKEYMI